jgi:two-component system, sensor histidine kinase and response regulator
LASAAVVASLIVICMKNTRKAGALPPEAASGEPPEHDRKASILLVDDRPDKLMALEAILSDLNQHLVLARSGREALRCLLLHDFAVILLDVNMPGMDGFETAAFIRQRKRSEHTPIIFMSASSDTDNHMTRGYSLGAVDYIVTPALPEVLKGKVAVFVELHKKTDRIRALNAELEKRVEDLTEINQQLERFTYSIAHDLRAPLRAMEGFASMIAEDYGDRIEEEGLELTGRIMRASSRLDRLISDLLEYSRLSRTQVALEHVELDSLVSGLLHDFDHAIREKQAKVRADIPPVKVLAHPHTLTQIVHNLLENALKFHRPGQPVCVRLGIEHISSCVRFYVEDNGIGIDPEHQERIFGIFERLHGGDLFPGTGIGLAIVRKGAERMGCEMGMQSTPGQGSRFWIDLAAAL